MSRAPAQDAFETQDGEKENPRQSTMEGGAGDNTQPDLTLNTQGDIASPTVAPDDATSSPTPQTPGSAVPRPKRKNTRKKSNYIPPHALQPQPQQQQTSNMTSNTESTSHPAAPPPPTAAQQQQYLQQHQAQPHALNAPHPPPPQPQSQISRNLEHPPGYIQNPTAVAGTTPAGSLSKSPYNQDQQPDLRSLGLKGKWVWEPAPGEAGGRYVHYYVDTDTDDHDGDDGYGHAHGAAGGGGWGESGGGWDTDGLWPDGANPGEWISSAWGTTMGWARSAGSTLVQVEEGIWGWVNKRT